MDNSSFESFVQEGLERAACLQKIALDLYARQASSLVSSWKNLFSPSPFAPGTALLNLAEMSIVNIVELQRTTLDLIVQSNRKRVDEVRDANSGGPAIEAVNEAIEDEADAVLPDEDEESQIAVRVVDRIAELVGQADAPLPADVATQQNAAAELHRRHERRRRKRALRARGSNHRAVHPVQGTADPSSRH